MWYLIIDDKTRHFKKILQTIKNTVNQQEKEYKKIEAKIRVAKETDKTGYDWDDYLADIGFEYEETTQILYKSFFVSVVMFMESKLLELCKHCEKEFKHLFNVYDLKGNGIRRSINYLKKIGINFSNNDDMNIVIDIRNILVHADGKIDNENQGHKDTIKKIKRLNKIKIFNDELIFTEDYLDDIILLNEKICEKISKNKIVKNIC